MPYQKQTIHHHQKIITQIVLKIIQPPIFLQIKQFELSFQATNIVADVHVDGILQENGYQIDGNILTFEMALRASQKIDIKYTTGGVPLWSEISVSRDLQSENIEVLEDSELPQSDSYSVDLMTGTISFDPPPELTV